MSNDPYASLSPIDILAVHAQMLKMMLAIFRKQFPDGAAMIEIEMTKMAATFEESGYIDIAVLCRQLIDKENTGIPPRFSVIQGGKPDNV